MRRAVGCLIALLILVLAAYYARDHVRRHPQDVPWTQLDLADEAGMFTVRKLVGLRDDPGRCRALLRDAQVADAAMPPRGSGALCGYRDGMRLAREITFVPSGVVTSCSVAAALVLLDRDIVQPAAKIRFGSAVIAIDHAGSYSCRRLYGRAEGAYSEHATATAFDVTGFRLADGTRISVLSDWRGAGSKAAFLRDVRDGACRLFATVLSPDYNAAHADHLHFDQARRGQTGGVVCS